MQVSAKIARMQRSGIRASLASRSGRDVPTAFRSRGNRDQISGMVLGLSDVPITVQHVALGIDPCHLVSRLRKVPEPDPENVIGYFLAINMLKNPRTELVCRLDLASASNPPNISAPIKKNQFWGTLWDGSGSCWRLCGLPCRRSRRRQTGLPVPLGSPSRKCRECPQGHKSASMQSMSRWGRKSSRATLSSVFRCRQLHRRRHPHRSRLLFILVLLSKLT